jgi:hypothetical protein
VNTASEVHHSLVSCKCFLLSENVLDDDKDILMAISESFITKKKKGTCEEVFNANNTIRQASTQTH